MANKKARRPYNSFGRRILAVLGVCGGLKHNVLLGLAKAHGHGERFLNRTLERLGAAGLISETNRGRGGRTFALAKTA